MNYAGRCLKCIDCRVCHVSFKDYSVNQRLWKTIMQEKSWSHFLPIRLNGIAIGSVNSQSSCVFWNLSIAVQYLSSCIFQRSRTEETWVKWKWCYSSWMTTCWGLKSPNKCCSTSDMNNTVWKQLNRAKKKKKIWYRKVPVALASGVFNCTIPQPYNIYIYARLFCSAGARVQHPVVLNVDGIFK